mmetsp:Transcript_8959/g.11674  ORF Transcript_8959/g.11674 Transcript_8959/m.11674 type:complete len:292 (-) Transcript_8959:386-1261(-)
MEVQALPVACNLSQEELLSRMRAGIPPESASEYLARVKAEAKLMPDVLCADQHTNTDVQIDSNVDHTTSKSYGIPEPTVTLESWRLPNKKWRDRLLVEFVDLRQYLFLWRERMEEMVDCGEISIPRIPKRRDGISWYKICFGNECVIPEYFVKQYEKQQNSKKKPNTNSSTVLNSKTKPPIEFTEDGSPPFLQLILHIDHGTIERLIYDHVWSLQENEPLPTHKTLWLFALLSRLEKPLTGDVASTLTKLVRFCVSEREKIPEPLTIETKEQLSNLNILICIVEDYFKQRA